MGFTASGTFVKRMNTSSVILGLVIALAYGALYHLLRNGGFWRLLLYLILSVVGFAAGYFIGNWLGWLIFPLGSIDLGASSIGSLIFLVAGDWLSRIDDKPQSTV